MTPTLASTRDVKRTIRRVDGARKLELAGAHATVKRMAVRAARCARRGCRRSSDARAQPPVVVGAAAAGPSGERVTFEDSELVWQYFSGQGLEFHPLANFGKLKRAPRAAARESNASRSTS